MSLAGGFLRGYPVSPSLKFRHCFALASLHTHRLSETFTTLFAELRDSPRGPGQFLVIAPCVGRVFDQKKKKIPVSSCGVFRAPRRSWELVEWAEDETTGLFLKRAAYAVAGRRRTHFPRGENRRKLLAQHPSRTTAYGWAYQRLGRSAAGHNHTALRRIGWLNASKILIPRHAPFSGSVCIRCFGRLDQRFVILGPPRVAAGRGVGLKSEVSNGEEEGCLFASESLFPPNSTFRSGCNPLDAAARREEWNGITGEEIRSRAGKEPPVLLTPALNSDWSRTRAARLLVELDAWRGRRLLPGWRGEDSWSACANSTCRLCLQSNARLCTASLMTSSHPFLTTSANFAKTVKHWGSRNFELVSPCLTRRSYDARLSFNRQLSSRSIDCVYKKHLRGVVMVPNTPWHACSQCVDVICGKDQLHLEVFLELVDEYELVFSASPRHFSLACIAIGPLIVTATCLAGAAVAERLDCSPPKLNRAQSPAGSLPDFRRWESRRTMPLVARVFSGIFRFSRTCIPAPLHAHLISQSSALETSCINLDLKLTFGNGRDFDIEDLVHESVEFNFEENSRPFKERRGDIGRRRVIHPSSFEPQPREQPPNGRDLSRPIPQSKFAGDRPRFDAPRALSTRRGFIKQAAAQGFVPDSYVVAGRVPAKRRILALQITALTLRGGPVVTRWTRIGEAPGSIPGPPILTWFSEIIPGECLDDKDHGPFLPQSIFPVQLTPSLMTSLSTTLSTCIHVVYSPTLRKINIARSPPTKANRDQSPAGSPDFRKWESCRTMPLIGGVFFGDLPFLPPLHSGATPYSLQTPSSALKTTLLRAAQISSLNIAPPPLLQLVVLPTPRLPHANACLWGNQATDGRRGKARRMKKKGRERARSRQRRQRVAKEAVGFTCSECWGMEMDVGASGGQAPCILRASDMLKQGIAMGRANLEHLGYERYAAVPGVAKWRWLALEPDKSLQSATLFFAARQISRGRCHHLAQGEDLEGYVVKKIKTNQVYVGMSARRTGSRRPSPPTKANRVQSPVVSPDFHMWESCRTMPLVGVCSRGSPVSPAPSFRRCSILASITLIGSEDLVAKLLDGLSTPQPSPPASGRLVQGAVEVKPTVTTEFRVKRASSETSLDGPPAANIQLALALDSAG
ncbi:hypothetical protein PR048_032432 [Dryococelus australis]|uniref:Uncharacterized protein n=1 Tax=Dryococelus australis TaxID=614101 RepID=A0ABQ9G262_9NEOP|nr:hypothetical protein PR048_032432 [Dryococelus australis]